MPNMSLAATGLSLVMLLALLAGVHGKASRADPWEGDVDTVLRMGCACG